MQIKSKQYTGRVYTLDYSATTAASDFYFHKGQVVITRFPRCNWIPSGPVQASVTNCYKVEIDLTIYLDYALIGIKINILN